MGIQKVFCGRCHEKLDYSVLADGIITHSGKNDCCSSVVVMRSAMGDAIQEMDFEMSMESVAL